jgi:hypothetical protein
MKRNFLTLVAFACLLMNIFPAYTVADTLHTPSKGSPERKAIMDVLRESYKQYNADSKQEILFQVHYLKVQNGWAWADVTPLGAQNKPIAEGGTALLRFEDGKWSSIDLATILADPDNPMGDQEASPGFLKNLHQKYPQAPMDIFPKKKK